MKKMLIVTLLISTTILTGCDKSQMNVFNYAHKEPELMEDTNYSSTIKDILEGYSDGKVKEGENENE